MSWQHTVSGDGAEWWLYGCTTRERISNGFLLAWWSRHTPFIRFRGAEFLHVIESRGWLVTGGRN